MFVFSGEDQKPTEEPQEEIKEDSEFDSGQDEVEPSQESEVVGGLEKLASLRAAGALTDEEFRVAKARVIGN